MTSKATRRLWIVCVGALAVRLGVVLTVHSGDDGYSLRGPDARDYLNLADHLVAEGTYSKGTEPELFRAPGYPFFLVPFRWLWPGSVLPVMLAQALTSTGTCLLTWGLTRRLFPGSRRAAFLAVVLQSLSVASIIFCARLMSETVFTFWLTALLVVVHDLVEAGDAGDHGGVWWRSIAAGTLVGACCLSRAIMLPMVVVFIAFLWARSLTWTYRTRFAATATFSSLALTSVWVWIARNYAVTGYPGFASVIAVNVYLYHALALIAHRSGTSLQRLQEEGLRHFRGFRSEMSLSQADAARLALSRGSEVISEAPFTYLAIHLAGSLNSFAPAFDGEFVKVCGGSASRIPTRVVAFSEGIVAAVRHYFSRGAGVILYQLAAFATVVVVYLGCVVAFIRCKHWPNKWLAWLCVLAAAYLLIAPGPIANYRFRVPAAPILSAFGAYGLTFLWNAVARPRRI